MSSRSSGTTGRVDLGGHKPRDLLGLLVAAEGRSVPVDTLIDQIWGDHPPGRVEASLQSYVARLRRALEPGRDARATAQRLRTHAGGYSLEVGPRGRRRPPFGRLLREARRGRRRCGALLTAALDLWQGDGLRRTALAGPPTPRRRGWPSCGSPPSSGCWRLRIDLGDHAEAVAELEQLVARAPAARAAVGAAGPRALPLRPPGRRPGRPAPGPRPPRRRAGRRPRPGAAGARAGGPAAGPVPRRAARSPSARHERPPGPAGRTVAVRRRPPSPPRSSAASRPGRQGRARRSPRPRRTRAGRPRERGAGHRQVPARRGAGRSGRPPRGRAARPRRLGVRRRARRCGAGRAPCASCSASRRRARRGRPTRSSASFRQAEALLDARGPTVRPCWCSTTCTGPTPRACGCCDGWRRSVETAPVVLVLATRDGGGRRRGAVLPSPGRR